MKAVRHAFAAAIGAGAIVAFSVGQAQSQARVAPSTMVCMSTKEALAVIERSGETEKHRGMADTVLVQGWANEEGSFTFTVRPGEHPEMMCVIAAGDHWHTVSE